MQTTNVMIDDQQWHINHNSDWSGDAVVRGPGGKTIELPAKLLVALSVPSAIEYVRSALLHTLEGIGRECG